MAEILAVTWGEEELALRRVSSEGIWNQDAKLLKRVTLQRPTRTGRLAHPEVGGALGVSLTELFADVDINVPCWLLLPNNWTLRFISEPPDLKSQELTLNHLRWESKQRISGDPADYKISAALMMGGSRYFICITRSEVIQRCLSAAEAADLELAGIGLEPNPNENYTFEHPLDIRDALPLEVETNSKISIAKKKVSPAIVGMFFIVVLLVGSSLIYFSGTETTNLPTAQKATRKTISAEAAITPPPVNVVTKATVDTVVKPELISETPVEPSEKIVVDKITSTEPVKLASKDASIIRGLFAGLPAGAKAELIVLSPVDLKIEASGIKAADQWLDGLKNQPGWASAKLVGNYETAIGRVTSVRIENPGWSVTDGKPSTRWQELAKTAGMSVKDRIASGKLDAALILLDQIWNNSGGLSKVYLSPVGDSWQVVVQ